MRIIKFLESTENMQPFEIALSELKLTVKDMEAMLYKLTKYSEALTKNGDSLIKDLEKAKESGWKTLRKWKIENMINRYEFEKIKIEEFEDIEDYLLEMEDIGWEIKIHPSNMIIEFRTSDHPIKKMSGLFHFLEVNKRLGFILKKLRYEENEVIIDVVYNLRDKNDNRDEEKLKEKGIDDNLNYVRGLFNQYVRGEDDELDDTEDIARPFGGF